EMAARYDEEFGEQWLVVHNGVANGTIANGTGAARKSRQVLLAGDVNVFRFDAVLAFAEAVDRYNQRAGQSIDFTVMGEVAEQHVSALSALRAVKLLSRRS